MVKDAQTYSEEDKKRRQEVEVMNRVTASAIRWSAS